MKYIVRILILVPLLLAAVADGMARDPLLITKNSEGREFWVCFMKNFRESGGSAQQNRPDLLKLQLFLTSSYDANVRIRVEEINYDNTIQVRANTVVNVALPARAQLRSLEVAERLAVHITADTTIAVYGLNSRVQTTDTYMGLPVSVLGTEYRAIGYTKLASDLLSQISVIATEDSTEITVTPTTTTSTGRKAGQPFTMRLRKGDVYSIGARFESVGQCDLTGTHILSNKNIAVFSGHQCAYVPPKVEACNHLVEQLPPISAWGMHYYLGMLKERSRYTYRVIASEDATKVFEDARLVAVLKAGEFFENLNVARHIQLTADKPVLVAQFAQGFKNGDSVGDPMMILVSPTQQFLKEYRFATPINGDWHHYINVVAPTPSIRELRLNGRRIDSNMFVVLGESRYSIAQVPLPYGTHVIKSETPFGLYSYGFGFRTDAYDAYGNMAGQSFFEISRMVDTLAPTAEGKPIRDDYQVTFRDDRVFDRGLKSVKVLFASALEASIPKIDEGAPQAGIRVRPSTSGSAGRMVLQATDAAGNESTYTLCYMFDSRSERYVFMLNEGRDVICAADHTWQVGAYGSFTHAFQTTSFSTSGNLSTPGTFGTAQGPGGWFGLLVGRRMSQDIVLTARLSLTTVGGTLLAPDSTMGSVFDTTTNTVVPYQEGTTVKLSAPYLNLGLGIEYTLERYFYVLGGLQASMPLGSAVDVQRTILRPANRTFGNGQGSTMTIDPTSLSSLNGMNFGLYGGLGFAYPVSFRASVFLEGMYTTVLSNLTSEGMWRLQYLSANLGVRWRF